MTLTAAQGGGEVVAELEQPQLSGQHGQDRHGDPQRRADDGDMQAVAVGQAAGQPRRGAHRLVQVGAGQQVGDARGQHRSHADAHQDQTEPV